MYHLPPFIQYLLYPTHFIVNRSQGSLYVCEVSHLLNVLVLITHIILLYTLHIYATKCGREQIYNIISTFFHCSPIKLTSNDLELLPNVLVAVQLYRPLSALVKFLILSSLLPLEVLEIRTSPPLVRTVLFICHTIPGSGLPSAEQDTTNSSPNTTSRFDRGDDVRTGGTI